MGKVSSAPHTAAGNNGIMIDPAAQGLLAFIEQRGLPATETLLPTEARALYRERRFFTQPEPPPVALSQDLAGPVPMRLVRPLHSATTDMLPVLVYFHGGGWT